MAGEAHAGAGTQADEADPRQPVGVRQRSVERKLRVVGAVVAAVGAYAALVVGGPVACAAAAVLLGAVVITPSRHAGRTRRTLVTR